MHSFWLEWPRAYRSSVQRCRVWIGMCCTHLKWLTFQCVGERQREGARKTVRPRAIVWSGEKHPMLATYHLSGPLCNHPPQKDILYHSICWLDVAYGKFPHQARWGRCQYWNFFQNHILIILNELWTKVKFLVQRRPTGSRPITFCCVLDGILKKLRFLASKPKNNMF